MKDGISNLKAQEQLKKWGYNELPSAKPKSIARVALEVIREPMFILLLSCGTIYLILGNYSEGIILLCWVFIIIGITFYQHRKTEKSLEALRQLASPRALVIRDGTETRIPGREVVPEDVILLQEGDRVPADALVLESNHLIIDESLLTGESLPVHKNEDSQNQVYSGTLVVQGRGLARVIGTGINTEFGKIGTSLQGIEEEGTRLQREMKKLIFNLFIGGAIISIGVISAFYVTRGDILNAVLNGLAAAMALLPEEFPVVLTIFLALGAWRLSRNKVLTRKPSAIETLGSATVLCSDKTGTITQNKMEIAALYSEGNLVFPADFNHKQKEILALLTGLKYASQNHPTDPMEKAIHQEYKKIEPSLQDLKPIKEYPLSKALFAMTRVLQKERDTNAIAYCKGAPEAIYSLCQLSQEEINQYTQLVQQLAEKGYRVLAAAQCDCNPSSLPEDQRGFIFQFSGIVAFEDPIRPEVPEAIRECYQAGIQVMMITGDYPATAMSIANQIGLKHNQTVLKGVDINRLTATELQQKIQHTSIFARIVPEQKLQIIRALKANGEIVAMTGDGVNDAPALKAADIGVAMGLKGTDVAREASALVLLDDNFASIVQAIRSGRRIFDNLQKAMSYIIAIHIPIIGLVLLPAFFPGLPILLFPLHIVFMELIIDPVCAIAFESEQEEKGIMNRPPRKANERFFGWHKITFSLVKGLTLLGMVVGIYFLSMNEGHRDGEIRAITFSALIIGNVFLILTSLSETRQVISVLLEKNLAVISIILVALVLLILTVSLPFFKAIFAFEDPGYSHFMPALLGALGMLLVLEGLKWIKMRRR